MYKDKTLKTYLDDLAARIPAPGGGSAAALSASLGTALLSMVINFTLGKPGYEKYQGELKDMLKVSEKLRQDLFSLVDLDVQAYKSKNLRNSLNVPFMLARLCFEAIKLCQPLVKKGNVNLVSDVAVAAVLLESAFVSACFNVDINLKMIKDKKLAIKIRKELSLKAKKVWAARLKTEDEVGKIIRG